MCRHSRLSQGGSTDRVIGSKGSPGSSGGKARGIDTLWIYFANYTEWGPKAEEYLDREEQKAFHVHMGVETHLSGLALKKARRNRKKSGYKSYVCPATDTGRGGNSGGTWVLVQKNLASHGALPGYQLVEGVPQAAGEQWSAAVVRVKNFDIVVVSLYMESGVGLNDTNMRRLEQLAEFLKLITVPFLVLGDWNLEPSELESISWPHYVRARIVVPENIAFTCSKGKGRLLDYAVVSYSLWPYFRLFPDLSSPWKPHMGLKATIEVGIYTVESRSQVKPRNLKQAQGPVWDWGSYVEAARADLNEVGSTYPVDDVAHDQALSNSYALFSRAAQLLMCDQASVERGCVRGFLGKGMPAKFRVGPSQSPTKTNRYTHDPNSNNWAASLARLGEYLRFRLHRRDTPGASGNHQLVQWFSRVSRQVEEWGAGDAVDLAEVSAGFAQVQQLDILQLSGLVIKIKNLLHRAQQAFVRGRRKSFSQWLKDALKNGGRACPQPS